MTEAEYADLLEYVRRAMREHGLSDFDARLASELYGDAEERQGRMSPSMLLLRYLDLLASRLQLQAAETAGGVLGELNDVARTEAGHTRASAGRRLSLTRRAGRSTETTRLS